MFVSKSLFRCKLVDYNSVKNGVQYEELLMYLAMNYEIDFCIIIFNIVVTLRIEAKCNKGNYNARGLS